MIAGKIVQNLNIFITVILRIQRDKLCKVLNVVLSPGLSGTRSYCDDLTLTCKTIQVRPKLLEVSLYGVGFGKTLVLIFEFS